jgi:hypothetical protein
MQHRKHDEPPDHGGQVFSSKSPMLIASEPVFYWELEFVCDLANWYWSMLPSLTLRVGVIADFVSFILECCT